LTGEWTFTKNTHSVIELVTDKERIYFSDQRNFGTVEFVTPNKLTQLTDQLGPDLLQTQFTAQTIKTRIQEYIMGTRGRASSTRGLQPIVKILLDQTILGSGIGNYLSAEILYDAKIAPTTTLATIFNNDTIIAKLTHCIKHVIKFAFLDKNIGYMKEPDLVSFAKLNRPKYNFHPDITINPSDNFSFKVYKRTKDPDGHPIKRSKIVTGRTTYWSSSQV